MRRKITIALISLAMLALGTVAVASPASAASGGSFCFHEQDDTPFSNKPVSLELSSDGNVWFDVLALQTDENGCAGFTLTGSYTDYYVRGSADWYATGLNGEVFQRWFGTTIPGSPGGQYESLLNNLVYCASVSYSTPCR
ncbi:MAG: hypothetical protein NTU93_02725 [Arthrobacter sp.]|nr:hypothetical protein [Arthrobacter sp.]